MPYKTKLVPATTANITTAIINRLNADGHYAKRINNAGVYNVKAGAFRRTRKDQKGISDIIACLYGPSHIGRFVAIEIKNTGDRQSPDQIRNQEEVENAGGVYLIIEKLSDFTDWYESSIFKP
jgi:hypothetical protein